MKIDDVKELVSKLDDTSSVDCTNEVLRNICKASDTIKTFLEFYEYWSSLYGQGLEVLNWHQNGESESFDNFYESATRYIM